MGLFLTFSLECPMIVYMNEPWWTLYNFQYLQSNIYGDCKKRKKETDRRSWVSSLWLFPFPLLSFFLSLFLSIFFFLFLFLSLYISVSPPSFTHSFLLSLSHRHSLFFSPFSFPDIDPHSRSGVPVRWWTTREPVRWRHTRPVRWRHTRPVWWQRLLI